MMQWLTPALALAVVLATGCNKEKASSEGGLPAADNWQAPSPMSSDVGGGQAPSAGADPHAGMGGDDPHAGMNMGGDDPHAGMNMGGADPHAGMGMGGAHAHGSAAEDPAMAAMQPPDPNRPIDESKFLAGSIAATGEVGSRVEAGAIMFLSVRPINPATGEIIGGPVAVDRIDVNQLPVSFRLTERNAMSAGTTFRGDVLIQARIDGDGEARTRSPGDVTGELRASIPSDGLKLTLDTVLE